MHQNALNEMNSTHQLTPIAIYKRPQAKLLCLRVILLFDREDNSVLIYYLSAFK